MTTNNSLLAETREGFLPHVLRWLAIICVARGLLGLASSISEILIYRYIYWGRGASFLSQAEHAAQLMGSGLAALLAVAGVGLLRRRGWSRRLLLVWAITSMATGLAGSILSFARMADSLNRPRPTTLPRGTFAASTPSLTYYGWLILPGALSQLAFPLLVFCITIQPEVAKLWAGKSGSGFEVLPFAKTSANKLDRHDE